MRGAVLSVGVGRRLESHGTRPLVPLRLSGSFRPQPQRPWYAVSFGVGGGLGYSGLGYITLDGGVRLSTGNGIVDVYAQPVVALSIPLARPRIDDTPMRTTLYGGLSVGIIGDADGQVTGSLDLSGLLGASLSDSGWLALLSGALGYQHLDE